MENFGQYLADKMMGERHIILTLHPHMSILGSSSSAANEDMMSKIKKMGIQFSDWVENIVGKEEIAHYEQFLLFPQCFQKQSVVDALRVSME